VKKTRDASNRLLPLIRTTCTRTSCVPDSLRWLPNVDVPRTLRLRTTYRGTECFTTPETASADRHCVLTSSSNPSRAGERTWAFSSHGAHAAEPLTPLSRLLGYILSASSSFPDVACFFVLALRPRFYGLEGIGGCGNRQAHRLRRLVKADASFWTGMPSIDRDPS
jgi:hypothetical protein